MNAFADWLFSALFGWMGSAANGAWNALVNASGGISSFFSNYWLLFLLAAIIAGTALDYAVWLARWRPYLVWRSWITRHLRRRRMQRNAQDLEYTDMDEQTRGALAEWVTTPEESYPIQYDPALYQEVPAYDAGPYYAGAEPDPNYAQQYNPGYAEGQPNMYGQQDNYQQPGEPLWQAFQQPIWMTPPPAAAQEPAPLSGFQDQPLIDYVQPPEQPYYASIYGDGQNAYNNPPSFDENNAYIPGDMPIQEQAPVNDTSAGGRRRRSDRKQRPMKRLFDDIRDRIGRTEDEESMLDGLPSSVRPEDAFHEAVYPKGYHYQDPNNNGNPGNQQ